MIEELEMQQNCYSHVTHVNSVSSEDSGMMGDDTRCSSLRGWRKEEIESSRKNYDYFLGSNDEIGAD